VSLSAVEAEAEAAERNRFLLGLAPFAAREAAVGRFPGNGCCQAPRVDRTFGCGWAAGRPGAGKCEQPMVSHCLSCGLEGYSRCKTTKASLCRHCASIHRVQVQTVAVEGLAVLGGVDGYVDGSAGMLTLTAPGEEHHCGNLAHIRRGFGCRAKGLGPGCWPCPCSPLPGVPFDLALVNSTFSERRNRFMQALRRGEASPLRAGKLDPQPVEFFSGKEVQKRGALHSHELLSIPGGVVRLDRARLRKLAMKHGFGHEVVYKQIHGLRSVRG
jgi:hypothetical protein